MAPSKKTPPRFHTLEEAYVAACKDDNFFNCHTYFPNDSNFFEQARAMMRAQGVLAMAEVVRFAEAEQSNTEGREQCLMRAM
jgi:hypothetical protein